MKQRKILAFLFSTLFLTGGLVSCQDNSKPDFTGRILKGGKVGIEYEESIALKRSGVTYEIDYDSDLPLGLELSSDGIISGIPEMDGDFKFDIVAVSGRYYTIANFQMSIEGGEITFEGKTLPNGKEK